MNCRHVSFGDQVQSAKGQTLSSDTILLHCIALALQWLFKNNVSDKQWHELNP